MTPAPRVIVVGAGVAGLSAGFRLQQQGCDVTVLEATDRIGGKTASVRRDGYVVNTGATVLAGSYEAMFELAADVGVADRVFSPPAVIGVVRDGKVHELRGEGLGALMDFVRTPLLSGRSKLKLARMGVDVLRARKRAGYGDAALRAELDTETVAEYCDRRLNAEIRDHLFGPVLGGIFVVDGRGLSMADLYFTLWKVLLGGMRGFRGGMGLFAQAVAERLDVQTGASVRHVERVGDGVTVRWDGPEGPQEERVAGVVLTIPAPHVPPIHPGLDPDVQAILLEGLDQANYISIRIGLSRRPSTRALLTVAGPDELDGIATISYEHNLSEGSAPAGKGLLGVLLYHEWGTPRLSLSDEDLLEAILPALDRVEPGIAETIEFAEVTRWSPGAVNSTQGTHQRMAEIDRRLDPRDRVQLAGDYRSMPSVNGSIVSGEVAASRLAAVVKGAPSSLSNGN